MNERVLVIRELIGPDGGPPREFAVSGARFQPLGFQELNEARLHQPISVPLRWQNAKIVQSNAPGLPVGQFASGHATLESSLTSKAVSLVPGGWLPSALASEDDAILLLDRCVVSELRTRFASGRSPSHPDSDFLDLFADTPVRINPLFFALEGNRRRFPSDEEAKAQLEEAAYALRRALPKADVIAADQSGLKGVFGLLRDSKRGMQRKQDFLLRVAPHLAAPVARSMIRSKWANTLKMARECGVRTDALVVLAALSVIATPNGRSPAKQLLKLRNPYSAADAYNALSDLRSLDILMHVFALYPHQRTALCTTDKPLALFWTGLKAGAFQLHNDGLLFGMSPEVLFPDIAPEMLIALNRPQDGDR